MPPCCRGRARSAIVPSPTPCTSSSRSTPPHRSCTRCPPLQNPQHPPSRSPKSIKQHGTLGYDNKQMRWHDARRTPRDHRGGHASARSISRRRCIGCFNVASMSHQSRPGKESEKYSLSLYVFALYVACATAFFFLPLLLFSLSGKTATTGHRDVLSLTKTRKRTLYPALV